MNINLNCVLQKKTSQNGKDYFVLFIKDIAKSVFLTETEMLLVQLLFSKSVKAEDTN